MKKIAKNFISFVSHNVLRYVKYRREEKEKEKFALQEDSNRGVIYFTLIIAFIALLSKLATR